MSPVWKPVRPPPVIATFSNPETETVWQFMLAKYRKERNQGPDPQQYYSAIYQKQFGVVPHSNQITTQVKEEPATPSTHHRDGVRSEEFNTRYAGPGLEQVLQSQSLQYHSRQQQQQHQRQQQQQNQQKFSGSFGRQQQQQQREFTHSFNKHHTSTATATNSALYDPVRQVFHIEPQIESQIDLSTPTSYNRNRLNLPACEKRTALDDSCYELEFDFEISPQEGPSSLAQQKQVQGKSQQQIHMGQPEYQTNSVGSNEQHHFGLPQRNLQQDWGEASHLQQKGQKQQHQQQQQQRQMQRQQQQQWQEHQWQQYDSSKEHHLHKQQQQQQPPSFSQDSLDDVDLQNLGSQPLFSQLTTTQAQNDRSSQPESIEIIGEDSQLYCSPPLDLSPDTDTYGILSEMTRKWNPQASHSHRKTREKGSSIKDIDIEVRGANAVGHRSFQSHHTGQRSIPLELYGTDRNDEVKETSEKPRQGFNDSLTRECVFGTVNKRSSVNDSLTKTSLDNVSKKYREECRRESAFGTMNKSSSFNDSLTKTSLPNVSKDYREEECLRESAFRTMDRSLSLDPDESLMKTSMHSVSKDYGEVECLRERAFRTMDRSLCVDPDESFTKIARCTEDQHNESTMSSSSLSVFKHSLQNSSEQSTKSKKRKCNKQFKVLKQHKQADAKEKQKSKKAKLDQSATSEQSNSTPNVVGSIPVLSKMDEADHYGLKQDILGAKELSVTLVFLDGSCLLQHKAKKTTQKKQIGAESEACGVAIAYPGHNGGLQYILLPFLDPNHACYSFVRELLDEVMSSTTITTVCYDAQQVIYHILHHFQYDHLHVCVSWAGRGLEDPKIWGWLLQSDDPPLSFSHLLEQHCKELLYQIGSRGLEGMDVQHCLATLGRACVSVGMQLASTPQQRVLYATTERPLIPVLAVMELTPVTMDTALIHNMQAVVQKKLVELEKAAHSAAGQTFSINSHPQLRLILFEKLKLHLKVGPGQRLANTGTGQHRSTCEATLTKLEHTHPLPSIVLQHRQLQKLKSTYLDGLLGHIQHGNELYTHWEHTAAATGRLTSAQPNIQAVPKQAVTISSTRQSYVIGQDSVTTSTDILARAPFVSRHGYSFLAADFQQMEFRLFAHLAADPVLLEIFNSPHAAESDVFTELTAQWKGTTVAEVKKNEKLREQTKRVVYSVMYGVGKEKLSEYLKTTPDEAKAIMNSFLASFPGVSSFSKTCVDEARAQGYQQSLCGRRRYLPAVCGGSGALRAQAERQAVNFCVQGSAADVSKAATVHVQRALAQQPHLHARLLFHIHDELLLEVEDHSIPQTAELVRSVMENSELLCGEFVHMSVPLPVSLSVGKSWATLTPYTPTATDRTMEQTKGSATESSEARKTTETGTPYAPTATEGIKQQTLGHAMERMETVGIKESPILKESTTMGSTTLRSSVIKMDKYFAKNTIARESATSSATCNPSIDTGSTFSVQTSKQNSQLIFEALKKMEVAATKASSEPKYCQNVTEVVQKPTAKDQESEEPHSSMDFEESLPPNAATVSQDTSKNIAATKEKSLVSSLDFGVTPPLEQEEKTLSGKGEKTPLDKEETPLDKEETTLEREEIPLDEDEKTLIHTEEKTQLAEETKQLHFDHVDQSAVVVSMQNESQISSDFEVSPPPESDILFPLKDCDKPSVADPLKSPVSSLDFEVTPPPDKCTKLLHTDDQPSFAILPENESQASSEFEVSPPPKREMLRILQSEIAKPVGISQENESRGTSQDFEVSPPPRREMLQVSLNESPKPIAVAQENEEASGKVEGIPPAKRDSLWIPAERITKPVAVSQENQSEATSSDFEVSPPPREMLRVICEGTTEPLFVTSPEKSQVSSLNFEIIPPLEKGETKLHPNCTNQPTFAVPLNAPQMHASDFETASLLKQDKILPLLEKEPVQDTEAATPLKYDKTLPALEKESNRSTLAISLNANQEPVQDTEAATAPKHDKILPVLEKECDRSTLASSLNANQLPVQDIKAATALKQSRMLPALEKEHDKPSFAVFLDKDSQESSIDFELSSLSSKEATTVPKSTVENNQTNYEAESQDKGAPLVVFDQVQSLDKTGYAIPTAKQQLSVDLQNVSQTSSADFEFSPQP